MDEEKGVPGRGPRPPPCPSNMTDNLEKNVTPKNASDYEYNLPVSNTNAASNNETHTHIERLHYTYSIAPRDYIYAQPTMNHYQ
jgi:hypothetical protein